MLSTATRHAALLGRRQINPRSAPGSSSSVCVVTCRSFSQKDGKGGKGSKNDGDRRQRPPRKGGDPPEQRPRGEKKGASGSIPKSEQEDDDDPKRPRNPQDFVKVRFEPGQWNVEHDDPLFLPPPPPTRVKIISEEEFLNRPTSGFSAEFASLRDARMILSWMNHDTKDRIYEDYLHLMESMYERETATSHEYVTHVIAQKYRISPDRVAALIAMGHEYQESKRRGDPIDDEMGRMMDEKIQGYIRKTYAQFRETPPEQFMERPVATQRQSRDTMELDDTYDLDAMEQAAIVKDREFAQSIIDSKVYLEDVDPSTVETPLDADAEGLVKLHSELQSPTSDPLQVYGEHAPFPALKEQGEAPEEETGETDAADGEPLKRRPRWKFAAKTVDTRKGKESDNRTNTLVEHDGVLRAANEEELSRVSWKPKTEVKEKLYRHAKRAWLEKTTQGKDHVWGKAPDVKPPPVQQEQKQIEESD